MNVIKLEEEEERAREREREREREINNLAERRDLQKLVIDT